MALNILKCGKIFSLCQCSPLILAQQGQCKGPYMAKYCKPKICTRGTISWGKRGSGVRDMALLSLGNLGAKFSEMSFPHFKTYFTQICHCHLWTTIFLKSLIPIILLRLQCFLSNICGPEKEKLCIL